MNEQLANFFVEFTVEGLEDVKEGLSDINDKLDSLDTGFGNATKGAGALFGSLGLLLGKIGLFGSVLAALGAAIANAFDVGDRAVDLKNLSDATGVSAEKLETMGIVLRKYGGDIENAGALYKDLMMMMTEYGQGKIPESHREMLSRYSEYGLSIHAGMTPDEILANFNKTFNNLRAVGNYGAINQIAEAYGLDQSVMVMLMQSMNDLTEEVKGAKNQLVLSREDVQENAMRLKEAKIELKQAWDNISAYLIPIITKVVEVLTPFVKFISKIFEWLGSPFEPSDETDEQRKIDSLRDSALKASRRIKAGNYSLSDIYAVKEALDKEIFSGWTDAQYGDAYKSLRLAVENLQSTNTPLNTYNSGGNVSSDNRSVSVGSVNVYGDTGSIKGIRSALGSAVREEMGVMINTGTNARGVK